MSSAPQALFPMACFDLLLWLQEALFTWTGLTMFLALVGAWYLLYQLTLIVKRRLFGLRENMDALAPLSLLSFHPATLKGHRCGLGLEMGLICAVG